MLAIGTQCAASSWAVLHEKLHQVPFIATMPIWVVLYDLFIFKNDRIGSDHLAAAILTTLGAVVLITSQN